MASIDLHAQIRQRLEDVQDWTILGRVLNFVRGVKQGSENPFTQKNWLSWMPNTRRQSMAKALHTHGMK